MTETLALGYSSKSTLRELFNEYQHNRVKMDFENLCNLVLCRKAALALEGLNLALFPRLLNVCVCGGGGGGGGGGS